MVLRPWGVCLVKVFRRPRRWWSLTGQENHFPVLNQPISPWPPLTPRDISVCVCVCAYVFVAVKRALVQGGVCLGGVRWVWEQQGSQDRLSPRSHHSPEGDDSVSPPLLSPLLSSLLYSPVFKIDVSVPDQAWLNRDELQLLRGHSITRCCRGWWLH